MKRWKVVFEARKQGAIGTFGHESVVAKAEDPLTARDVAMRALHDHGFETRFPVRVEGPISE